MNLKKKCCSKKECEKMTWDQKTHDKFIKEMGLSEKDHEKWHKEQGRDKEKNWPQLLMTRIF